MRIKNNPKIFYLACGLLAEGDKRYDRDDAEIAALADKIREALPDADISQWFNLAKTGQIKENPYWPRGHAMLMAVLFMDESAKFDIDRFAAFMESINMQDPVGKEEFRQWIGRLPEILTYAEGIFRNFWKEYCEIIFARTNSWMPKIEASRRLLKEFFGGGGIPNLVLIPNLFASPFVLDFVTTEDGAVTLIACKPDIESMLHHVFREEIAKCRGQIIAFSEEHGLGNFADEEKMREMGYMQNGDNIAHVIEECFVRAFSAILAGGGERRLESHADMGFTGLPAIAHYFGEHRPKSDNLGNFIDIVLKGMTKAQ